MENEKKISVGVIVGPTASGKTALAVEMARRLSGEVISADSMQIYKGLPVSTACPTEEEKQGIPHHLLEFLPLSKSYSVSDYVRDATAAIYDVAARGHFPILAGGTGLYVRSLVENRQYEEEPEHQAVRDELLRWSEGKTDEEIHEVLQKEDPGAAIQIHPHNRKRVLRALERYRLTGRTLQEQNEYSRRTPSPFRFSLVGLSCRDRAVLYRRIDKRVDRMMDQGLLQEAKALYGTPCAGTAAQAIGCKELFPYLKGEISLLEATEKIKQGTRRYAKRQLTWFHKEEGLHWLNLDDVPPGKALVETLADECEALWRADGLLGDR